MKPSLAFVVVAIGTIAGLGAFAQAGPTTVDLKPQNNSAQTGTVTFTAQGDQTVVVIKMTGAPAGVAQPAHIHDGSCANIDPRPRIPLQNVSDGSSTTVVPVKLDQIMKAGGAINVHKSAAELQVYVACGDLK